MPRRGRQQEYEAKKRLQAIYGSFCVCKTSVYQNAPDFLVTNDGEGRIVGVEVKSRKKKPFRSTKHDREQWLFLKAWMNFNACPLEYWIRYGKSKDISWEKLTHEEFGERYIKR